MVRTGAPPLVEGSLLRLGASSEGSARRSSSTMEPPGAKGDPSSLFGTTTSCGSVLWLPGARTGFLQALQALHKNWLMLVGSLVRLTGYVETSGADLDVPLNLLTLLEGFIH